MSEGSTAAAVGKGAKADAKRAAKQRRNRKSVGAAIVQGGRDGAERVSRERVQNAVKQIERQAAEAKAPPKSMWGKVARAAEEAAPKQKNPRYIPNRNVDPLPTKGKYPKGTGPLIEAETTTQLRRLLSKNRSFSERSWALDKLQDSRGKIRLPDDETLRQIIKDEKKIYGVKGSGKAGTEKKGVFENFMDEGNAKVSTFVRDALGKPSPAAQVVGAGAEALGELNDRTGGKSRGQLRTSGLSGSFDIGEGTKKALKAGALASGSVVIEGLDRPVGFTEAGIGKALENRGFIKGEQAERIRKARGPLEVLAKGRNHNKDITGGTLVEGLGGPRQLGYALDLAADPLMYGGLALAPATGGGSLALVAARIRKVAPELLESPAVVKASREFNRSGDEKVYRKALQGELRKELKIRRNKGDDLRATIAEGKANRFTLQTPKGKKSYSVPSRSGQAAVTQALRQAEARAVKPEARIQMMLPTGRTVVRGKQLPGLNTRINIGGIRLPNKSPRDLAVSARIRVSEADKQKIDALADEMRLARADLDEPRYLGLQSQIKQIEDTQPERVQETLTQLKESTPSKRYVADYVREKNASRAAHLGVLQASEFGRTTQAAFSRALEDANKLLDKEGGIRTRAKGKTRALERVQLHLIAAEGQGGIGRATLEQAGIKLTDKEQQVFDNYRTIYDAILKHGQDTGVLEHGTRNYAGYRVWNTIEDPDDVTEAILRSATKGSTAAFTKHRSVAAVTDLASVPELRAALVRAGATEEAAAAAATILHRQGRVRAVAELTARKIQRQEPVYWLDLTPTEIRAIDFASSNGLNAAGTPLFRTPRTGHETEGQVLPGDFEGYGLPVNELEDGVDATEAALRKLYSANLDRQQVRGWLEHAEADELDDLKALEARLSEEIDRHTAAPEAAPRIVSNEDALKAATLRSQADIDEAATLDNVSTIDAARATIAKQIDELENAPPGEIEVPAWVNQHKGIGEEWTREIGGYKQAVIRTGKKSYRAEVETPETLRGHGVGADVQNPFVENVSYRFNTYQQAQRALDKEAKDGNYWPTAKTDNTEELDELRAYDEELVAKREQVISEGVTAAGAKFTEAARLQLGNVDPAAIPPENALVKMDERGNPWIMGDESPSRDLPIENFGPRSVYEPKPEEDPFDWTSRLPDERSKDGAMVELDPRVTGYIRARSQGISTSFQARWQSFDEVYGRSTDEYADSTYTDLTTGEQHAVDDLLPIRDDDGRISHYVADNGRSYDLDEIEFDPKTLIPNSSRTIWLDPLENQEYLSVRLLEDTKNELMVHNIAEDRVWPAQAIDDFKMAASDAKGMQHDLYYTGMEHAFGRVMSMTRFGVTVPFPAYHIRNLVSDMLKSMQADSGVMFHPIVNYKLTLGAFNRGLDRKLNVPGLPKMEMEDFLFLADAVGIRTGHHAAEVMQMAKTGEFSESELLRIHQKYNPLYSGGPMTKFGSHREDVVRYMTFMQRLRHNGGDAADAAWYTIRHHFNYNDLHPKEKTSLRNVFLFYTWYRKNVPLQLVELVRRPGFFAGVESGYHALEQGETPLNVGPMSGRAPDQPLLPDYVKDRLQALTTNWNGFALNVGFGAPWSDLALASEQGSGELIAMTNPFLQAGFQTVYSEVADARGMDPLTGREYKAREPGGAVNLANFAWQAVGGGELPKNEDGKYVLPWWAAYGLRSVPLLGRGSFNLTGSNDSRPDHWLQEYGSKASNLTGLSIFMSPQPGTKEYGVAKGKIEAGIAAERRDLIEGLSKEIEGKGKTKGKTYFDKKLKEFDDETAKLAKRRKLDLTKIKGSGKYKRKRRKSEGNGLGSGGSGNYFGGGL